LSSSPILLSIVVVSRNDDHGGNLIYRMQLFVTGLLEQARRHNLNSELVIVEWNPPPDRPRLAQALEWPKKAGPCAVRIIEVPPEIHRRFKHSDGLPLFQMIGKNVGIRRALGRFVLATNIDILFSDEIVRFFASGQLMTGHMYRVDRYDVPSDIPDGVSIDEQLVYCRQNILRINTRGGTRILKNGDSVAKPLRRQLFFLAYRTKQWLRHEERALHTNACGDFTLMAREHWSAVHGYAEFEMYSLYLDGLLCYAAHCAGAREMILRNPMRIYHIEHSAGSGWSPGIGGELMNKRLSAAGIPQLNPDQYYAWERQMRRQRQPITFNEGERWGLANESLPEIVITEGTGK